MRLRSMLFVPGDSDRKAARAVTSGADALIFDLEDSVAPAAKAAARTHVASLIAAQRERDWRCFVRVNALDTDMILEDLAAVVQLGLNGLMIPKANGGADVATIAAELDRREAARGMAAGSVKLVVVATETAAAMFNLGSYTPPAPRLAALTWGAEDLSAAIGASANKEDDGEWTFPYQVARAQCLFAATAAGVPALDTLYADFRDSDGLERDCRRARRDGFAGRIAIHPGQVAIINRCFTPSTEDLARAQRVVDAFAAQPNAGTIGIDGRMYDIPHLKAAHKTLASA